MNEPLFQIRIASGGRTLVTVDDFAFAHNGITFLFGESGIGKSLISKAVYGLIDPGELSVSVNGRPYHEHLNDPWTRALKLNSFFVFQEPSSHLNPLMTIAAQIREGSLEKCASEQEILKTLWQASGEGAAGRILDIFPKPYRPSGGEKQRVLLAMAFKKIDILLQSPSAGAQTLFVFDEPTGSLDNAYRNLFLKMLLEKYRSRPFTILIITHDYSIISEVYRSHRDLAPRVRFSELSRKGPDGQVTCHAFSPEQYLTWLERARAETRAAGERGAALEFGSQFTVFARPMRLFADAAHMHPADLLIRRGEMAYVKAPSGVGKTTLAKIVMGLVRPERVSMRIEGVELNEKTPLAVWQKHVWGKRAGMVFQHADEALNVQARVREIFRGLPLRNRLGRDGVRANLGLLFDTEITDAFLAKRIGYLSGGQKQRLNLLRTLALDTALLILDEPLNGLDFDTTTRVLDALEKKRRAGSALLMISHNEEIFDALVEQSSVYYLAEQTPKAG